LRFRERLVNLYPEIFGSKEDREAKQDSNQTGWGFENNLQGFNEKWGWTGWLIGLCNNDIRNLTSVSELPLHQCFIFTSYKLDYNNLQEKLMQSKTANKRK